MIIMITMTIIITTVIRCLQLLQYCIANEDNTMMTMMMMMTMIMTMIITMLMPLRSRRTTRVMVNDDHGYGDGGDDDTMAMMMTTADANDGWMSNWCSLCVA